jgi:type II secretory pathway component PulF
MTIPVLGRLRNTLDAVTIGKLDRVLLAKHLATMIHAGIVLDEALDILIDETANRRLRRVLTEVKRRVDRGEAFAAALRARPAVFSELLVEMVRIGEESGTLEENLLYVATQLEHDYDLRRKIRGAAAYPTLVLVLTFLMGLGLTYFILPKLIPLFTSLRVELPLSTRIVLATARFTTAWGYLFFPGVVVAFFGLRIALRSDPIRPTWHRLLARIPLVGKISVDANLAITTRTLGILLRSGLPITEALRITAEASRNENYRALLVFASREVEKGLPLSESLRRSGVATRILPVIVPRMIGVGERTGTLAEGVLSLADFYEREVDSATKNLSTVLEPALIIVIGLAVLLLALSIISPIYKITGSIQPQ